MREKDLRAKFKQIDPDQVPGGLPMIRIIEEACIDLHRLADALEDRNSPVFNYSLGRWTPGSYQPPSARGDLDDDIPF